MARAGFPRLGRIGRLAATAVAAAFATVLCGTAALAQLGLHGEGPPTDMIAPFTCEAVEVHYDVQLGLRVAKGHVEISQNNEILLADTVSYNRHTDTVTASGHVSLLLPTGEVVFGDFMELRDSMKTGFAQNVRMLLADRSRLAANTAP